MRVALRLWHCPSHIQHELELWSPSFDAHSLSRPHGLLPQLASAAGAGSPFQAPQPGLRGRRWAGFTSIPGRSELLLEHLEQRTRRDLATLEGMLPRNNSHN